MDFLKKFVVWIFLLSFSRLTVLASVMECKYRDKETVFNPFSPSIRNVKDLSSHFPINRFPCGFKMAKYQCGKVQTEVIGENSLDKDGLTYLSDVTVVITTVKRNETTRQTLKLCMKRFKRYLSKGDFAKSPWRWSYTGTKPKRRHRITGYFNNTTKTAVVATGGVVVTFSSGRVLTAQCNDSDFTASEGFDQGDLCGRPDIDWRGVYRMYDDLNNRLPACTHHRWDYHKDYIMLAMQKEYHTKPLCREAANILLSPCENKADKAYECYKLYEKRRPNLDLGYGECIRTKRMDPFKVYVACLRALCKTDGHNSNDTCNSLRRVETACRKIRPWHRNMTAILAMTDCDPLPVSTTTTTTTTETTSTSATTTIVSSTVSATSAYSSASDSTLELGAACNESSQCGNNAQCFGDPAKCTCKSDYTAHNGHCGKKTRERCTNDTDCLPLSYCFRSIADAKCVCNRDTYTTRQNFCYKKIGSRCELDKDCGRNAHCSVGVCACNANFAPDHNKNSLSSYNDGRTRGTVYCYLKLGKACNSTSDCPINTQCTGNPKQCACLPGYVTEKGRCGKPVGAACEYGLHRRCVLRAGCEDGTCQCATVGWGAAGQFCKRRAVCSYVSRGWQTSIMGFSQGGSISFDPFPCSYKMANIRCGDIQAAIIVDNKFTDQGNYYGRIFMGNVTVYVTTVDAAGIATSQINRLDIDKLQKLEATRDYNSTIWEWSFVGSEPPRNAQIHGKYDKASRTPVLSAGQLNVNITEGGMVLSIFCTDPRYSTVEDWPRTFCGGPKPNNMYGMDAKAFDMTTDPHHVNQRNLGHDIMTLIKQKVNHSNPLCNEAASIATSPCKDLGENLYKIRKSFWVLESCMRRAHLSEFEFYVSSLRVLCGFPANSGGLDACHVFREVAGHCRVDTGSLNLIQLLSMAGCNTTFTTTTTTTRAPRYGGWK